MATACMMMVPISLLRLCIILAWIFPARALEQCQNGHVCPEGNTCCAGGCIASDLGELNATCCSDSSGCGVGYVCGDDGDCLATSQIQDPLVQTLPRYSLCHPSRATLETVHGFSVDKRDTHKLAYYSSHGDVTEMDMTGIDFVFIIIHGSSRNADDYYCAATAAVNLQARYQNVLILSPRYLEVADGPIMLRQGGTALRWDINGTWRYGARSVLPTQISSFAATDLLVETILARASSAKVAVVGHSAGGQFVQRWALLTSIWSLQVSAVVANPSSYAMLTPLRKLDKKSWQPFVNTSQCPQYNFWEWGLDAGGDFDDWYKIQAMELLGNSTQKLIGRFRNRHVTYVIGSQDRCNVSGVGGWCHSHGLETLCMDELQGRTRMERHLNYFESLALVGIHSHERQTVQGVGHDHSLLFTRPEGLSAIFGDDDGPSILAF